MSSSTSGIGVEAASTPHQSFIALIVTKVKSAYHFTFWKKISPLAWSGHSAPLKYQGQTRKVGDSLYVRRDGISILKRTKITCNFG